MNRFGMLCAALGALVLTATAASAQAQDVLVRNATVHTQAAAGVMEGTDVLVRGGKVAAIGKGLAAPAGVAVVEAGGRPLTPGLFAGLSGLGIEEVSAEPSTVDVGLAPGAQMPPVELGWRPEFDVSVAYNPRSSVIGVNRAEGLTWTVLAPSAQPGGSFVTGQGAAVVLDGGFDSMADGSRTLFVDLGGETAALAGGSRAAQYMLLEQAIEEARSNSGGENALLTPAGRRTLQRYLDGGRVAFAVDRAADIRQVLRLSRRAGFQPIIVGGAEAWVVADELARAKVPVLLDALVNLPGSFDQLGASLQNAARLHAVGVPIAFSQAGDATHNARKVRQLAGNAVANGLPYDAALAALTATPAQVFGLAGRGRIEVGSAADLVLWSGDPLEVTTWAEQVWIDGIAQPTRTRQTELLERYLPRTSRR